MTTNLTSNVAESEPSTHSSVITDPVSAIAPPPPRWQRFVIGGCCLALGLGAAVVGLTSIYYRLTHMTVLSGIINGRTVRIQAPINGTLQDFYGQAGVPVQSGQVLATLEPLAQQENSELQLAELQKAVEVTALDLKLAQQTLDLLTRQQSELQRQNQQLRTATVAIATHDLSRYQAALDEAIAREAAARTEHERYQSLFQEGAVSEQQRDQLETEWESAQAAVQAARAELGSARTVLNATQNHVPVQSSIDDVEERQQTLQQQIQTQLIRIEQLTLELADRQAELERFAALYGEDSVVQIKAPFTGVIYTTRHETGEQVSRPATLLTLLDCNDLWVETLVSTEQATRIDVEKPVRVRLTGASETLTGEVAVVEAVSMGALTEARTKAILPAVPPNLVGQPLARVRVNIPPTEYQAEAHQFCGLGRNTELTFGMKGWGQP